MISARGGGARLTTTINTMDDQAPKFGSDAEAAQFWRERYEEIKDEFEEYKDTSAEIEKELERELGVEGPDDAAHAARKSVGESADANVEAEIVT